MTAPTRPPEGFEEWWKENGPKPYDERSLSLFPIAHAAWLAATERAARIAEQTDHRLMSDHRCDAGRFCFPRIAAAIRGEKP